MTQLNKTSKEKYETSISGSIHRAAAEIFRRRVVVVDSVEGAKAWMETSSERGTKVRLAFVDFCQFASLQVKGDWSKALSVAPGDVMQKELVTKFQTLPMTPIVGSLLVRCASGKADKFFDTCSNWMPYSRSIFIPIDVPAIYEKCLRSAARRALGPVGDLRERTGSGIYHANPGRTGFETLRQAGSS